MTLSNLASAIVATMSPPVLALEEDLSGAMANRASLGCVQVSSRETVGQDILDRGNGQCDLPQLRQVLTERERRDRQQGSSYWRWIEQHQVVAQTETLRGDLLTSTCHVQS